VSNEYDVVVVGGGIAGLTCAAYSCKYGYRTLLLEKSNNTGGLVKTFRKNGYAFDGGIRAFENTGIVLPMLKNLGIDIEIVSNPVSIGIENKWARLESRESLKAYSSMLAVIFPENRKEIDQIEREIKKVMEYMDVIYGIDNPLFRDDFNDKEYLVKTLFPWLLKYQYNIGKAKRLSEPAGAYLKRITINQALIDMVIQHFFAETPTFFALSYFGLYLEYFYPKGGTAVLVDKIADYVTASGGDIITNAGVTKINTEKNQVFVSEKIYSYKKLVWAANQKSLYEAIEKQESIKINNQRELVSKGITNDSILTVFLGVNKGNEYFMGICGAHAFYTPSYQGLSSIGSWKNEIRSKEHLYHWIEKFLELTTYEISCPALRDASLAPYGKTGVIISTLMDYNLVKHISDTYDYEDFKDFCTKKIIGVISKTILPEIQNNIEMSMCATPLTIEHLTSNKDGSITGWSFANKYMPSENNFKKITKSIYTPIDNIYQCGQWTFCPSGLPVSVLTGKCAADEIKKAL